MAEHSRELYACRETESPRRVFVVAALCVALSMFVLAGRLWYLQLVKSSYFRDLSEHNRIRLQHVPPARGMIFDRNGELLVHNQPGFDLSVVREDVSDMDELLQLLNGLLGLDPEAVQDRLDRNADAPPFLPVTIKTDLSWEELAKVETYRYEAQGLTVRTESRRAYRPSPLAVHLIGYTGEVTQRQLALERYHDMRMGDRVGQYGVEQSFQNFLAGRRGGRQLEVDATGRQLKVLNELPAQSGHSVFLTIDSRVQEAAEQSLQQPGAVVALDPRDGQILAMVSRPTFDQLAFVRGLKAEEWKQMVSHELHPLENRAISGQYPPGSTFKVVMAVAGLMEGAVTPEHTFHCPGFLHFGNRDYGCWKKGGHGTVNLHQALVMSCDVYFYRLGQRLGVDRIAKWAHSLGLGGVSGVDLASEKPGLVPTAAWKKKRFGVPWQDGETLSISIGQGFNLTTPLQLANMAATVANGGTLYRPGVVLKVEDPDGNLVQGYKPRVLGKVPARPEVLRIVRQGMAGVVNDPRGTGRKAAVPGVLVAGKTGTSQVVALTDKYKGIKNPELIPRRFRDHAVFVSFAPVDNPEIAVAVLVEHAGMGGGAAAAPVAGKVIDAYFKSRQEPRRPATPTPVTAAAPAPAPGG